jgi:two-component system chemotaxis response regulator CheY
MPEQASLRILIVEDDRTSRIVLRRLVEGAGGVEVREAEDGLKAWEMLEGGLLPDLCLVDINMPRMDGLELLKRIRGDARLAGLKVCFCSAVVDAQTMARAAASHPDDYILKPYVRAVVEAQVRKARAARAAAPVPPSPP